MSIVPVITQSENSTASSDYLMNLKDERGSGGLSRPMVWYIGFLLQTVFTRLGVKEK
jgi:hypothetical protein